MDAQARKALFRAKLKEQAHKTRINSQLVRYNEFDQPICRVCDVVIKSESLWPAHQASKKHHESINNLKANASRQKSSSNLKSAPVKELAKSNNDGPKLSHMTGHESSSSFQKPKEPSALPVNFFDKPEHKRQDAGKSSLVGLSEHGPGAPNSIDSDSSVKVGPLVDKVEVVETSISGSETTEKTGALPEGFFDNKEADLRARGIKLVKPDVKDEYKVFEKLIQQDLKEVDNRFEEEEIDAAETIEEEEIVEQMTYKERVELLKRKRTELADSRPSKPIGDTSAASKKDKLEKDESSSEDDDDENFTLDWRAQHL